MQDAHGLLSVEASFRAAARTATANGTGVDIQQFQGRVKVIQEIGTVSGTTPTCDCKIQDSEDNSSFADVTGLTFTQVTAQNNLQSIAVDSRKVRRYIRAVWTIAGTTPSFTGTVLVVGQKKNV
jgi:hypothetical protein